MDMAALLLVLNEAMEQEDAQKRQQKATLLYAERSCSVSAIMNSEMSDFPSYFEQESSHVPTTQMQGSPNATNGPRACRAKLFCLQTRFVVVRGPNCPNPVREVKVRPVKNELHSRSFL